MQRLHITHLSYYNTIPISHITTQYPSQVLVQVLSFFNSWILGFYFQFLNLNLFPSTKHKVLNFIKYSIQYSEILLNFLDYFSKFWVASFEIK